MQKRDAGVPSNDRMRELINRAGSVVDDSISAMSPDDKKSAFFKPTRPQTAKNYKSVPDKRNKH